MANFYIDGTTLGNSTAVYQDSELTICAASGFYSDGIISREQVVSGNVCYLLPQQPCPSCAEPCGGSIGGSGNQGIYVVDLDVGGTNTDTGAIVVTLNPAQIPDGVIATYDGQSYNKLSSQVYGLLQSTVPNAPTFVGITSRDCGTVGGGTYPNLPVKNYVNGTFVNSGTNQTLVIQAGQSQLTPSPPNACVMVVPKPNATPATINVQFFGPCDSTGFTVNVACPTPLTQMLGSVQANAEESVVCGQGNLPATSIFTQYYHQPVPVSDPQGIPSQHDYIFNDENGVTFPPDGWYLHGTGITYYIESGIVIVAKSTCPTITVIDCIDGNQYTMTERFGGSVGVGDVIQYNKIINNVVQSSHSCGTISSLGTGVATNAIQKSQITRECGDSTHCPQV